MTKQNKTETKNRNNRMERFVKRSTDILVSVPCLVLFSPLFVIISLAINGKTDYQSSTSKNA